MTDPRPNDWQRNSIPWGNLQPVEASPYDSFRCFTCLSCELVSSSLLVFSRHLKCCPAEKNSGPTSGHTPSKRKSRPKKLKHAVPEDTTGRRYNLRNANVKYKEASKKRKKKKKREEVVVVLKNKVVPAPKKPEVQLEWFQCDLCPYKSHLLSFIDQHVHTHNVTHNYNNLLTVSVCQGGMRWYQCERCSYRSENQYELRLHILQNHVDGDLLFRCDDCPFVTMVERDLAKHRSSVHKDATTRDLYMYKKTGKSFM